MEQRLDYQGRCHRCLDTGICPGYNKRNMVVTMTFCDCEKGRELRLAAQKNPRNCPFCRPGKGEVKIGGKSPHYLQCPHVNPDLYIILPPAQLHALESEPDDDQSDQYACVNR